MSSTTSQPALDLASTLLSIAALILAIVSFWKSYLSPFHLEISNGRPSFSLYMITPKTSGDKEGRTWWIPSFDIGLSFHNTGQKTGTVLDVRLNCELKSNNSLKKYLFYAQRVVDYSKFEELRGQRMKWAKSAVLRNWYPLILSSKETQHVHLILEQYPPWYKREVGMFTVRLEVLTSNSDQWVKLRTCDLPIQDWFYDTPTNYLFRDLEVEALRNKE